MWEKTSTRVKYSLLAVNFTFLTTGIISLSVGYSVNSAYNGYHSFLSDRLFSIPDFCAVTGVVILLMAFFGFYGVYSGNNRVIKAFILAIGLTSVAQLSLSIGGFILQSRAESLVQAKMRHTEHFYAQKDYTHMKQWDEVQEQFSCCGVDGTNDWDVYFNFRATDNPILPISCCGRIYGSIGTFHCNRRLAYPIGCAQQLGSWAAAQMTVMGLVGTVSALTQALLCTIAFWLVRKPKTNTAIAEEIK